MALIGAQYVNAVDPNPVGSLQAFAGANAPTGWLLCDGSQQPIATYPELYSVLSTTYGALTNGSGGAGSTHFRVPDLRGRMPIGAGNEGVAANNATRTRGDKGGDTRMQSHTHDTLNSIASGGLWGATFNSSTTYANTVPTKSAGLGSGDNMPPFLVTNYIIKATSSIPRGGTALGSTPPIVTALPVNPQFGEVVTYAANATDGIYWTLQYDASGTYPWKFVGGAPLHNAVNADQTTTSTSFTDLGTVGPSVTAALPGDYDVNFGSRSWNSLTNNETQMGISFAGAAVDTGAGDHIFNFMGAGGSPAPGGAWHTAKVIRRTGFAGGSIAAKYRSQPGGTSWFSHRYMTVTPVRVKAA
jgi:microcystin-dependent protein